uniref:Uncharacterized protein n=1 Tax=Mesocestoides corti TaxID=53468 RepID=A0A5K3EZ06_MESCO
MLRTALNGNPSSESEIADIHVNKYVCCSRNDHNLSSHHDPAVDGFQTNKAGSESVPYRLTTPFAISGASANTSICCESCSYTRLSPVLPPSDTGFPFSQHVASRVDPQLTLIRTSIYPGFTSHLGLDVNICMTHTSEV